MSKGYYVFNRCSDYFLYLIDGSGEFTVFFFIQFELLANSKVKERKREGETEAKKIK